MSGDGTREEPLDGVSTEGGTQGREGPEAPEGTVPAPRRAQMHPRGGEERLPGTARPVVRPADGGSADGGSGSTDGREVPGAPTGRDVPAAGQVRASRGVPNPQHPARFAAEAPAGSGDTVLPGPWSVPPQRTGRGSATGLTVSDAELIRGMRSGDDRAYEELFRRHSGAVRRYARTCCRDAHTADDLTAEVFTRTLQAVRGGKGPEEAVRAYLMTAVRHVAAAWTKSAKREHLVDDFAVFAAGAARTSELSDDDTLDLGADVRAMHEAEQSMALQAFRSLPERWQAVLWHTTVEEESPSEVAPLFGLSANATAVLAGRAREGLKQAYLQAHVSQALVAGGDCARYADRLGAYARGGLRTRAERGLRKHLDECAKCRLAAGELKQVNAGIPALLPVAVIGWFAAAYSLKAAGAVAGGTLGVAGAGAAAAATGSGTGTGAAAGTASAGGAAAGGSGGGSAAGGAAAEGLGAPVKVGIAAAVAVAAAAGLVWALAGDDRPEPVAKPPVAAASVPSAAPSPEPPVPVPPRAPEPSPPTPSPAAPKPAVPEPSPPEAVPEPSAPVTPTPEPSAAPEVPAPSPPAAEEPPAPAPTPPADEPAPKTPASSAHWFSELRYDLLDDGPGPKVELAGSSPIWQRRSLSIASTAYAHGVTVAGRSSVSVRLDGRCTRYEAMAGIDDLALGLGAVRFSVIGAGGEVLWASGVVRAGSPAVPVSVSLDGLETVRLVVESARPLGGATMADWADSRFTCG
ncbi:sigma-70 family RNA polymerase sigma factor [Streptomyces sp. NBC_00102]|uniref:sigma-70 family RNA polymerase sigma factor n=1 Tax=Streptomyces sp. NBC_00102 TaxID=2975652 RepID=UPI0022511AC9|nr:sigma-70 family RNA polymerase sigma factor [Streptomyces sp. NBC_00102]MCX5398043.1 sigma-70 family RNA polymerase sigma factor [Streptomyces sp. NBC_00102]